MYPTSVSAVLSQPFQVKPSYEARRAFSSVRLSADPDGGQRTSGSAATVIPSAVQTSELHFSEARTTA